MTVTGILTTDNGNHFIQSDDGQRQFENRLIWDGYIQHWKGQLVCAREVPQKDYETGQPIILMWPHQPKPETPYVEIYYNERLVKYPASTFGHNAINVNGEFFNFSHLLNENETWMKVNSCIVLPWESLLRHQEQERLKLWMMALHTMISSAGISCGLLM